MITARIIARKIVRTICPNTNLTCPKMFSHADLTRGVMHSLIKMQKLSNEGKTTLKMYIFDRVRRHLPLLGLGRLKFHLCTRISGAHCD